VKDNLLGEVGDVATGGRRLSGCWQRRQLDVALLQVVALLPPQLPPRLLGRGADALNGRCDNFGHLCT
jgi:hypothetical protein